MVIELNSFYLPENKEKENDEVFIKIICAPLEDGKIQVEMTYEGDPFMLSYILKKAQEQFEQNDEMF